jgi:drug/metabolite transporter (DMT)-like permease
MSIALTVFMYAIWTSVFSLGKMALVNATPIFLTAARMLFGSGLILGYLAIYKRKALKIQKTEVFSLLLLALFSIYLTNILEFWGLKHLSAAKTCFIYSLSPFFAAFFSYLHFGEKMTRKKWIGMSIGFLGFFPVLFSQKGSDEFMSSIPFLSLPEIALAGAALCSVYGWVLLRVLVKDTEKQGEKAMSPLTANGYSMLLGGLFALITSFFADPWNPLPITDGKGFSVFQGILFMTLISNVLCYNLYGYLLKRFTATFLSFMGLLSPLFASLTSWLLLNERPSWIILCSTSVVILGLWLVYQEELKQGYIKKKEKVEA